MVGARDSARSQEFKGRRDARDKDARKVRPEGKLTPRPKKLVLTPSLRRKLKKPVGRLYSPDQLRGREFLRTLQESVFVITVGDRVTETMDRLGRTPDVQVVDEVERRVRRVPPEVAYARLLKAKNPAGTITKEAMAAIDGAVSGPLPSRVLVEGEEDLLVIPAIKAAPVGATIYYGQPGKGVVLVVVDERAKASAERLLASMAAEE